MDRLLTRAGDLTGATGLGDHESGGALVAAVAACLAVLEQETRTGGTPAGVRGMAPWKRAALAELMNAGLGIRDFI